MKKVRFNSGEERMVTDRHASILEAKKEAEILDSESPVIETKEEKKKPRSKKA